MLQMAEDWKKNPGEASMATFAVVPHLYALIMLQYH